MCSNWLILFPEEFTSYLLIPYLPINNFSFEYSIPDFPTFNPGTRFSFITSILSTSLMLASPTYPTT